MATMLEKQLIAAERNVEKAEKAIIRAEKKYNKLLKKAEELNCTWSQAEWFKIRDSGNYTKDQDWTSFEYR